MKTDKLYGFLAIVVMAVVGVSVWYLISLDYGAENLIKPPAINEPNLVIEANESKKTYTAEELDEIYKDEPALGKLAKSLWGVAEPNKPYIYKDPNLTTDIMFTTQIVCSKHGRLGYLEMINFGGANDYCSKCVAEVTEMYLDRYITGRKTK